MKITFTRNSYFILIGVASLASANLKAQSPTTFTATNIKVFDTLTNLNVIHAKALTTTDTLRAKDHVILEQNLEVKGWVSVDARLSVADTATFNGEIKAAKGFMFDANNGFKLKQFGGTNYFTVGKQGMAVTFGTCPTPGINNWMLNNGGGFVSAQQNPPSAPLVNSAVKMYSAGWDGNGYIEVEGTSSSGLTNNALLVNYFCGRDIALCPNTALANGGGKVSVGNFLSAAKHVEIGDVNYGITNAPNNIALDINVNDGTGLRFRSYNTSVPLISVINTGQNSGPGSLFTVFPTGKTQIGAKSPAVNGVHSDAMLSVFGKVVSTSFYVTVNGWADYVFEKGYKLMPISDVENYVRLNKHLPNIPTAKEVESNGVNIGETNAKLLEKLEEAYLYIIELNKKVDQLEKKVNSIK